MLSGRCATCKSRLSLQYPLVELATALFFTIIYIYTKGIYIGTELLFTLCICGLWAVCSLSLPLMIFAIKIIPDGIAYIFILASILRPIFSRGQTRKFYGQFWPAPPLASCPSPSFFIVGRETYGFWRCQASLGHGLALGALSRAFRSCYVLWAGGLFALILLCFKSKRFTMKSEIPFAPFLVLGTFMALIVPAEKLFSFLVIS